MNILFIFLYLQQIFFLVISICKITESFASIVIEGESVLKNIQHVSG